MLMPDIVLFMDYLVQQLFLSAMFWEITGLIGVTSLQIDLKNSDYGLAYYYLPETNKLWN